MADAKGVVFGFFALGKAGQAVFHAHGVHARTPARQDFMRVGLVAHVPYQAVVRGVEHIVQRHGQLDAAQVGSEVATGLADRLHQKLAQLARQLRQLAAVEPAQVGRQVDGVEQGIACGSGHAVKPNQKERTTI